MGRFFKTALILSFIASVCVSCDGKKSYNSTTDAFMDYPETELSTFSISGTASCASCKRANITALQVEVVPAEDPMTSLAMSVFDGLGSFYFGDIRYKTGTGLTVYGKLLFGTGDSSLETSSDIDVPGDGDVVSCVLNF
jgi:hypothetical protein